MLRSKPKPDYDLIRRLEIENGLVAGTIEQAVHNKEVAERGIIRSILHSYYLVWRGITRSIYLPRYYRRHCEHHTRYCDLCFGIALASTVIGGLYAVISLILIGELVGHQDYNSLRNVLINTPLIPPAIYFVLTRWKVIDFP